LRQWKTFKVTTLNKVIFYTYGSRNTVVGIVTIYWLGGPGFEFRQGQEIFASQKAVPTGSGAKPVSDLMSYGVLSLA
jgi:hypothetical protein